MSTCCSIFRIHKNVNSRRQFIVRLEGRSQKAAVSKQRVIHLCTTGLWFCLQGRLRNFFQISRDSFNKEHRPASPIFPVVPFRISEKLISFFCKKTKRDSIVRVMVFGKYQVFDPAFVVLLSLVPEWVFLRQDGSCVRREMIKVVLTSDLFADS